MSIEKGRILAISFDTDDRGKLVTMEIVRRFVKILKQSETHCFQAWATTDGSCLADPELFAAMRKDVFRGLSTSGAFAVTESIGDHWYGHRSASIIENLKRGKTVVLNQTAPGIMKLREFEFQGERPKVIAVQLTVNPILRPNREVYQYVVVHKGNDEETIRALMAI